MELEIETFGDESSRRTARRARENMPRARTWKVRKAVTFEMYTDRKMTKNITIKYVWMKLGAS
jgi:hypothetical protein